VQVEMGGLLVGTFQLGRYAYLAHLDLSKREPYQLFGQPVEPWCVGAGFSLTTTPWVLEGIRSYTLKQHYNVPSALMTSLAGGVVAFGGTMVIEKLITVGRRDREAKQAATLNLQACRDEQEKQQQ